MLAWLLAPGLPLHEAVAADVDLSAASIGLLDEMVDGGPAGRPAGPGPPQDRHRAGPRAARPPPTGRRCARRRRRPQADGDVEVVGVWSHFVYADVPGHPTTDRQLAASRRRSSVAERFGITPRYRHLANSAATLTRPDTHFDLVRPGIAVYGLSPGARAGDFGLRPAMTVRARVLLTKRVPAGQGVSYGHTYTTARRDHAGAGAARLRRRGAAGGQQRRRRSGWPAPIGTIAGRVCMDQIVLDCGDDAVRGRRRGRPVRPRRRRRADRRRLGRRRSARSTTRS